MGSWSSAYKPLMEHIVKVLSELPNYRFILSAGPLGHELNLDEISNVYGDSYVPQLKVLQR